MKDRNSEIYKIFSFILKNANISIQPNSAINRDTLNFLWKILKGEIQDTFCLSKEQESLLIKGFIDGDAFFDEDTPSCILNNEKCAMLSIERNKESINYLVFLTPNLERMIIDLSENEKFSINEFTNPLIKKIFAVALNSIKHDAFSSDFLFWHSFNESEQNLLIDELIRQEYILNSKSSDFLKQNKRIVMYSLKKNLDCREYMSDDLINDQDIFNILALNSILSYSEINDSTLDKFSNFDVFSEAIIQMDAYGSSYAMNYYLEKFNKLFYDMLFKFPKISTLNTIFDAIAEQEWQEHKRQNQNLYENIFAKICSCLRNSKDISRIEQLTFITNIESVLGKEKYFKLYLAMKEYYDIYHGTEPNKSELLMESQNIISKIAASYISKSKEDFKKEAIKECQKFLYPFFSLNTSNPWVKKQLLYNTKKNKFKYDFGHFPKKMAPYVNQLKEKYKDDLDRRTIGNYALGFILTGLPKFENIERIPSGYSDYLRYKKAIKLIHRLNSNYIEFCGPEVSNYKDLICLDCNTLKYVYRGINFSLEDLNKYQEYERRLELYGRIKRDIVSFINDLDLEEDEFDSDYYSKLDQDLPFTDQYFKFDPNCLKKFQMRNFIATILNDGDGFEHQSFLNDASYQNLYHFLVDCGAGWLALISAHTQFYSIRKYGLYGSGISNFINHMDDVTSLANALRMNVSNIKQLLLLFKLNDLGAPVNERTVSILGKNLILELVMDMDYTSYNEEQVIYTASDLVCLMTTRNKSTVPYVEGELFNYKYSLYDPLDRSILLSGIGTDSCFKCDGNDNDFLYYCALNKNGFVIKITDSFDNFVGRASGFRHGNCVFLNQLRTIYDRSGNNYKGICSNEKRDIIKVLKKACEDIIAVSQENKEETNPIDFIFINQCYCLRDYSLAIPEKIAKKIGFYPMDMENDNWVEFIESTDNLSDADIDSGFSTDYGGYPIICIASNQEDLNSIQEDSLQFTDTPTFYRRKRNSIIVSKKPTQEMLLKVNQIKAIASVLKKQPFKYLNIDSGSILVIGDNWYIILKENCFIESCVLEKDEFALEEFDITRQEINNIFASSEYENFISSFDDNFLEGELKILESDEKNGEGQGKRLQLYYKN